MKRSIIALGIGLCTASIGHAQQELTADSCRKLALEHNKELSIAKEKIEAARNERKAALTNYLPSLTATGSYMHNQKETVLLSHEQKHNLSTLGTTLAGRLGQMAHDPRLKGILMKHPELMPLLGPAQQLIAGALAPELNQLGASIVEDSRTDTRNISVGVITLTQPIYMGGKIRAYNKITRYAEALAHEQQKADMAEVILSTDQAYWQVISLSNKKKLAEDYYKLLQKLEQDVTHLVAEGVATKADLLSVKVKVNEAEMNLAKVEDGLSLSRMLLCQLCGISLDSQIRLADENMEDIRLSSFDTEINVQTALANRSELKSLSLATQIYKQKVNIARSEHLPSLALVGNYIVSNPSVFNGFQNKFDGMWNVGVMLKVPLWHWGQGYYKVRAAKAEARIADLRLSGARDKIELQVAQSASKVKEANKRLVLALKNMERAEENLRYANLGFQEGMIPTSNVLEAQTAWLSAHSSKIDAQIEVKLTDVYLQKVLGVL